MPKRRRRTKGTGSVYKRGTVYYAEVNRKVDGYRIRKKKGGFRTYKEADEYLKTFNFDTPPEVTVKELYDRWNKRHAEKVGASRQSILDYSAKHLDKILLRPITSVKFHELQAIIDGISSAATAHNVKSILSGIYSEAIKAQLLTTDLTEHLDMPSLKTQTERVIFTDAEIKKLWDAVDVQPLVRYVLLMIYTGMRPKEMMTVTPEMIDLENCVIIGAGAKTDLGKTAPIVFPGIVKPLLVDYIQYSSSYNQFAYQFRLLVAALGLNPNLVPYSCRHTCATLLTKADVKPATIQRIMRHTKYQTTLRYTHLDNEDALAAVNQMSIDHQ